MIPAFLVSEWTLFVFNHASGAWHYDLAKISRRPVNDSGFHAQDLGCRQYLGYYKQRESVTEHFVMVYWA